ncbi:MAG: endonuclease/exonuclease/phosphatase family protein [Geminicoccaceae bacterium]
MIRPLIRSLFLHWPWLLLAGLFGLTLAPILGDYSRKLDFLGQFLIQTTALTVAAFLLFLVLQHRLVAFAAVVCVFLQLAVLQPALFPARAMTTSGESLSVVFANVWTQNRRLPEVVERLEALDPDVIVLTEIREETESLLPALEATWPYRAACPRHYSCDTVVLSRLPILEDRSGKGERGLVGLAAARIESGFGPVTVAGTHLTQPLPPWRQRVQEYQTEQVVDMLAGVDDPLLVVGDFNSVPWGRLIRAFAAATGLKVAPGLEGTWPATLPWPLRIPIDQALTGRGLELLEREVVTMPGADHKALWLVVGPGTA